MRTMKRHIKSCMVWLIISIGFGQLASHTLASPYVEEHQKHDLVKWQTYNEQIWSLAKKTHKLIFISIGYSSCHWCHKMQKDVFQNPEAAKLLNENFIPVIVDREAQPDIDHYFMSLAEITGQETGWPFNIWLTPYKQMITTSTYLNAADFMELTQKIVKAWKTSGTKIPSIKVDSIKKPGHLYSNTQAKFLTDRFLELFVQREQALEQHRYQAPRFPRPLELETLLTLRQIPQNVEKYLIKLLDDIAEKGLMDKKFGGFFRYTVDSEFKTPHYEKMLYLNTQLVKVYVLAWRRYQNKKYLDVAIKTQRFIDEWLGAPQGGYYASVSADSLNPQTGQLEEGYYYRAVISGNKQPPRPAIDQKIITSWNALSIISLCYLYRAVSEKTMLMKAQKTAQYLIDHHLKDHILYHYSIANKAYEPTNRIEDYSHFIRALLEIYHTDFNASWLKTAGDLINQLNKNFWDAAKGMYREQNRLQLNMEIIDSGIDGDLASSHVIAMENLMLWSSITLNELFEKQASQLDKSFSGIQKEPIYYPSLIRLKNMLNNPIIDVVISPADKEILWNGLKAMQEQRDTMLWQPIIVIVNDAQFKKITLIHQDKKPIKSKTTYYVCIKGRCLLPTTHIEAAIKKIKELAHKTKNK